MTTIPQSPDALLTRKQLAEALTAAGFPVKKNSLDSMVTRGGGPAYRLFGRRPIYRWGDALDWANGRMSQPIRSSSELPARLSHSEAA